MRLVAFATARPKRPREQSSRAEPRPHMLGSGRKHKLGRAALGGSRRRKAGVRPVDHPVVEAGVPALVQDTLVAASGDHENACGRGALPMQRCRPLPADTAPARSSVRGERDSAAGTARTIEIVAFQYRECRRPGDSYVPQCDSDAVAGREDQSDGRGCTWHLAPRAQRPSPCQKQPSAFAVDRSRNFSSVTALCANSGGAIRRLLGRPFACACAPRAGGPGRPETAQACYVCGRSEAVDDDRADVLLEVPRPVPRFVVHEEVGLPLLA
jgi:hypothetical protein